MAEAGSETTAFELPNGGGAVHHGGEKRHPSRQHQTSDAPQQPSEDEKVEAAPLSPGIPRGRFPFQRRTSLDLDDYFTGPRDIAKHSKWPLFLQMHGSILPKMILPLFFVGAWSTAVTAVHKLVAREPMAVDSVLLTVLGFVVGLGLSFRSSTAYERYAEGRKYWAMLVMASQVLGRVFWIHAVDRRRDGADAASRHRRESVLERLAAMNLLVAFAVALKHALRFEPYTAYPDLQHLVGHLQTFAREATPAAGAPDDADAAAAPPLVHKKKKKSFFKEAGEYLGVPFAESNPRKALKRATRPLGNLPLEILSHLAATVDHLVATDQLRVSMQQTLAYNQLVALNDVMTGCERVLSTPLPIAYTISISQITWVYVVLLPFQLVGKLGWITIPATTAAAYIILGLLFIGREIENPFGQDVNDLPLDGYCEQVAAELDIIASYDVEDPCKFFASERNMPLYPVSTASAGTWMQRGEGALREAVRMKPRTTFARRTSLGRKNEGEGDKAEERRCSKSGDENV